MSNVEQNDTAIVVNPSSVNYLKVVHVRQQADGGYLPSPLGGFFEPDGELSWFVDSLSASGLRVRNLTGEVRGPVEWTVIHDSCLKPLRDKPGEDEVLRYAGKPEGVTA
jgi:hypothetical protein